MRDEFEYQGRKYWLTVEDFGTGNCYLAYISFNGSHRAVGTLLRDERDAARIFSTKILAVAAAKSKVEELVRLSSDLSDWN